jgi:hypothetical protein
LCHANRRRPISEKACPEGPPWSHIAAEVFDMPKTKSTTKSEFRHRMTYKQLVKKSCCDRRFARKIHKLVCKAREGGETGAVASEELNCIFKMTPKEEKECCLTKKPSAVRACLRDGPAILQTNPTSFMLLDFTKMV